MNKLTQVEYWSPYPTAPEPPYSETSMFLQSLENFFEVRAILPWLVLLLTFLVIIFLILRKKKK